jgi:acetyl-CoA acetyltransferase
LSAADLRGAVAIAAVGVTEQGELPGRSADEVAIEAFASALDQLSIAKGQVDGLITCKSFGGFGIDTSIGRLAGLNPAYSATLDYGTCNFSLHLAAAAIQAGLATTVAILYGTTQRSQKNAFSHPLGAVDEVDRYGFLNVAGPAAMAFRRAQHLYGVTERQLGHVAVSQRRYAIDNPQAIFRQPMSIEDYLSQPYLVAPLRRADLCMISDGGACLIVTGTDRARDLCATPVLLAGMAQQTGLRDRQNPDQWLRPWIARVAERIYANADIPRDGVDLLYIQDPTSIWVLQMLEAYGFVERGAAGAAFEAGEVGWGSKLPVNTNGGQLSEAYMWGFLHLVEAVRQLRGECGARQIPNARVAQYCSTMGFMKAASSILCVDPR